MMTRLFKSLRIGLLASCALCAGAAQAVSVSYNAIWDPDFGGTVLPNLGWRGSLTFSLDEFCFDTGEGISCSFESAEVTAARVTLYDNRVGTFETSPALTTLDFTASMGVLSVSYDGGAVSALTTTQSNFIDPTESFPDVFGDYEFALRFDNTGLPRLFAQQCISVNYAAGPVRHCGTPIENDPSIPFNHFSITRVSTSVPEPASLWLASLGLLGVASLRRSRRA